MVGRKRDWENLDRGLSVRMSDRGLAVRMSVADAARRLGVCTKTVRSLAHAGRLEWFWGNGSVRPSGLMAASVLNFCAEIRKGRR